MDILPNEMDSALSVAMDIQPSDKNSALLQAARYGQVMSFSLLYHDGADINTKSTGGTSVLHEVVGEITPNNLDPKVDILNLILSEGLDADTANDKGDTALHYAAASGATPIVETLVGRGANANAKNQEGDDPLDMAAMGGHAAVANVLIENGGAEVNGSAGGCRALGLAVIYGYADVVRVLLDHGANVISALEGFEILWAARNASAEIIDMLLQPGFREQSTEAMFTAAQDDRDDTPDVMKLLIDVGAADVLASGPNGTSILHIAVLAGRYDRPDRPDVMKRSIEMLRILLNRGASVWYMDAEALTPRELANLKGYTEAAQLLKAYEDKSQKPSLSTIAI